MKNKRPLDTDERDLGESAEGLLCGFYVTATVGFVLARPKNS